MRNDCWLCSNEDFDGELMTDVLGMAHYAHKLPDSLSVAFQQFELRNATHHEGDFDDYYYINTDSDSYKAKFCPYCGRKLDK